MRGVGSSYGMALRLPTLRGRQILVHGATRVKPALGRNKNPSFGQGHDCEPRQDLTKLKIGDPDNSRALSHDVEACFPQLLSPLMRISRNLVYSHIKKTLFK